jgi:hypothetical protein
MADASVTLEDVRGGIEKIQDLMDIHDRPADLEPILDRLISEEERLEKRTKRRSRA